ncbi:MAG: redoxin domain-containing protein, partial [Novosphingobium sp.]|nr:redoxin domain-containing protein [Novosphingobium sp.]
MIFHNLAAAGAAIALFASTSALAELKSGATAPDFTANGALAGKPFSFSLKQALQKGPVVLYFYPKAFTKGC